MFNILDFCHHFACSADLQSVGKVVCSVYALTPEDAIDTFKSWLMNEFDEPLLDSFEVKAYEI